MKALNAIAGLSLPWFHDRASDPHLVLRHGDRTAAANHLCQILAQLLARTRPGNLRFLFIDHAEQSSAFRAFAALGDVSGETISGGIVTRPDAIRKALSDIVDRISDIRQSKLRDVHRNLDAYNQAISSSSGASGEAYRYVVLSNWPHGFDAESCQLVRQIVENGSPCGVHVIATWEQGAKLPYDANPDEIWGKARLIDLGPQGVSSTLIPSKLAGQLVPAAPASAIAAIVARHSTGLAKARSAAYSFRTMMDGIFRSKLPNYDEFAGPWHGSASDQLVIPIGLAGGERIVSVVIGRGGGASEHNVLIVGPIGSGKSNLLHVMIQSVAELYGPDEVSLYLIDGKYGTEFALYEAHRPPHARVISLNSEAAFGISVLQSIYDEQVRRGELFQNAGTRDLSAYRERTGHKLPRILLFLDEFQQFLSDDGGRVSRETQTLLLDIARQGRAFGIHMVLATQTLKGVDLPRAVDQQIAVRIVLGRSPDGFDGVLSPENTGARSLERFHTLMNDRFGTPDGNTILQVAQGMDEAEAGARISEYHAQTRRFSAERRAALPAVRVFKGNEPASLRNSVALMQSGAQTVSGTGHQHTRLLIGEPLTLGDECGFDLSRTAGSNILAISRTIDDIAGPVMVMILSAIGAFAGQKLKIYVVHALGDGDIDNQLRDQFAVLADRLPDIVEIISDPGPEFLRNVLAGCVTAIDEAEALPRDQRPQRLLFLLGMHEFRTLADDPFDLISLLDRGPSCGFHVVGWSNTFTSVRKTLSSEVRHFGRGMLGRFDYNDVAEIVPSMISSERGRIVTFGSVAKNFEGCVQIRPFGILKQSELEQILGQLQLMNNKGDR
jgi:hypothetical protein